MNRQILIAFRCPPLWDEDIFFEIVIARKLIGVSSKVPVEDRIGQFSFFCSIRFSKCMTVNVNGALSFGFIHLLFLRAIPERYCSIFRDRCLQLTSFFLRRPNSH